MARGGPDVRRGVRTPIWAALAYNFMRGEHVRAALTILVWMIWFEALLIRRLWRNPDVRFSLGGRRIASFALVFQPGLSTAMTMIPVTVLAGLIP